MLQKMRVTCYDEAFEKFTSPSKLCSASPVTVCTVFGGITTLLASLTRLTLMSVSPDRTTEAYISSPLILIVFVLSFMSTL